MLLVLKNKIKFELMKKLTLLIVMLIGMISFSVVSCSNDNEQTQFQKDGDTPDREVSAEALIIVKDFINVNPTQTYGENYENTAMTTAKINCIRLTYHPASLYTSGHYTATGCATHKGKKYSFSFTEGHTSNSGGYTIIHPEHMSLVEMSGCNC